LLALIIFLLTAIITGRLTSQLRKRVADAQQHDLEMTALAQTSWSIASELNQSRSVHLILERMHQVLALEAAAYFTLDDAGGITVVTTIAIEPNTLIDCLSERNREAVRFVYSRALPLGQLAVAAPNFQSAREAYKDAVQLSDPKITLLPIIIENKVCGALYLAHASRQNGRVSEQSLTAFVNHIRLIVQRDKLLKAEALARALMEADKLKTTLLSMISHDFRSPLTSIKANIGTLLSTGEPLSNQVSSELLGAMDEEVNRLNRMVGHILDLSRLEAGAWRPKFETIPLTELIGTALSTFDRLQNQRIHVINESPNAIVRIDSVQIRQVLLNLLGNALKYSPDASTVVLRVSLGDEALQVEVLDDGIGIQTGEEELIFQPFFRASGAPSNVHGTGMGLAICRGLVEAHGGKITAMQRPGGGACFQLKLPNQPISVLRAS
jgi:two-component system sensor histidine kinase KdpD